MKNRVINKTNNSYICVSILIVYVLITLGISMLFLKLSNKDICLVVNDKSLYLKDGIVNIKGTRYITREDIKENFFEHVFYDKISRTLIITTWDEEAKIKKGDQGTIEYEAETVYSVKMLAEKLGYTYVEDVKTNNIYIYDYIERDIKLNKNRVEIYDLNKNSVIGVAEKKDRIILLETEAVYKDSKNEFLTVKITTSNDDTYIGRIKKNSVEYTAKVKDAHSEEDNLIVITHVENKVADTTDLTKIDALAIEMLELTSSNKLETKKYTLPNTKDVEIYAVIDNGYKSAGFDTNIITDLVQSDKNKEVVADTLINFVMENELDGIVIDFKKFKVSDKDLLEQYIKELAVLMHKNNKKILVKMQAINSYNIMDIEYFVDYILLQAYGLRTVSSKMAGPHSSITDTMKIMNEIEKNVINRKKIILEIPTYSILWTERGGTVIDAKEYSMQAVNEYLKENNVKPAYNSASGQNYVSYTKGIITYKMWLEDEYSIGKKMGMAYYQELAGVCVYKSGEELKRIYSIKIE
ncbi:MAG: hypothetical protein IKL68_02850 [Clostridia bacterium]|nr:hypothetical protein [Clostridia bacterium]